MGWRGFGAVCAIAGALWAGQARATLMVATYTGSIDFWSDPTLVFGPDPGGHCVNSPTCANFSLSFTYDSLSNFATDGSTFAHATGPETLSVTIHNITQTYGGTGTATRVPGVALQTFTSGDGSITSSFFWPGLGPGLALDQIIPLQFGSVGEPNALHGTPYNGSFFASSFSVSAAPIPEPATWALVIAGLGLAGAMLRRRRAMFAAS